MHIPDGFLDTKTVIITSSLSAVGFGIALRNLKKRIVNRQVPMMGLAAAFVFVAQMLNFPIIGGTSGHLIGSALVAILLGPNAAVVIMTLVLLVQCFIFADGGVLALGANIFNMAIVGSVTGYSIYRIIKKLIPNERGKFIAIAFASWCTTVLAAIFCASELVYSRIVQWSFAFPAMANIHMLIGIGEGLITTLVIAAVYKARPELIDGTLKSINGLQYKEFIILGIVITVGLLIFVLPFASGLPDGLETIASMLGFEQSALKEPVLSPTMNDYQFPGIGSPVVATWIAGGIGAVIVFILASILSRILVSKSINI